MWTQLVCRLFGHDYEWASAFTDVYGFRIERVAVCTRCGNLRNGDRETYAEVREDGGEAVRGFEP